MTLERRSGSSGALCGSYVLRKLVEEVPLSTDGESSEAQITCVELYEDNLYVGTSAGEILHFVSIPPEPTDESNVPTFIFASRLQPIYNQMPDDFQTRGVLQILVLAKVDKACILCNGTLSFYSLPELTPAFGNTVVSNCSWVGGANLNEVGGAQNDEETIMICVKSRIRLVRIGDEARRVRNIEYPGCLMATRRDNFACVADAHSYALLDVDNQQKISLFPISSLDQNTGGGKVEDISPANDPVSQDRAQNRPTSGGGPVDTKGHNRVTSLGTFASSLKRRQQSPQARGQDKSGLITPEPSVRDNSPSRTSSHNRSDSRAADSPNRAVQPPEKPLPPTPDEASGPSDSSPLKKPKHSLTPHICSPTPTEFLLTTGTAPTEPGVGIFVNLDGDVVRGTVEFSRYPSAVVVDGRGIEVEPSVGNADQDHEGFVLAAMMQAEGETEKCVIEVQRWDMDGNESKEWLTIPAPKNAQGNGKDHEPAPNSKVDLRVLQTAVTVPFPEVGKILRATRVRFSGNSADNSSAAGQEPERTLAQWEKNRIQEEVEFGRRLGGRTSHIAVWSGSSIWWAVRNPLAMRLDATINHIIQTYLENSPTTSIDRFQIIKIVNSIRGQEPSTETGFLSLEYIRQKSSLILFADLLARPSIMTTIEGADKRITEDLMMESGVDPRVMLSLIPQLRKEIIEGPRGVWIHTGLIYILEHYWSLMSGSPEVGERHDQGNSEITNFIKRYLLAWRHRKGFGSIADEVQVFQTVDATLLRVLLEQDRQNTRKSSVPSSARKELYALVDSGVECFDRAVTLLETYHRLYLLSRLYQSRKMSGKVLETWRRITDGERDDGGGELRDGENEVRKYLGKIKDINLLHEYATWLAKRNPKLGVQVFTDDTSRVKMEPHEVVQLLKRQAPDAVKVYLEHLVFGKKNVLYANDLISYYLDNVLAVLSSSNDARAILAQTYESYRALRPPKPTYRQFIIENEAPVTWWHDRLRLLELLGGSHGADFSYDVGKILARIEPFEEDLVPESIIIDGRQGRHQQALRLLTHGLGDYHTAINYCLLGGASIFHPISGPVAAIAAPSRDEQANLFDHLLSEFLRIEDASDRFERTSELLERFGSWYDVRQVLELIPESWSVDLVSGFLVRALRRLLHEKSEAMITKALSSAENLQVASMLIEKCDAIGSHIEKVQ